MKYLSLTHFRHFTYFSSLYTHFASTPVENIRQISPYLKKQSQISPFFTLKRGFRKKQTQFNEKPKKEIFHVISDK